MTSAESPIMSAVDVRKHYPLRGGIFARRVGSVLAVDGVSFDLYKGETLGLVGESGCGKSTLGRALIRLENPTSGQVRFEGRDLATASGDELFAMRRNLQMIFQDPYSSLNPRLTVGEIVREPLLIHRTHPRRQQYDVVRQLLESVGLKGEHADRYPHEFSGGQRQRIGIARALALGPKVIIADEPVSALDVSVQAQVINLMVGLQRERGFTYLFISHDLSVVDYISDRIAIMYLGRIVEIGPKRRIFTAPAHPYTRALIESSPVADPRARRDSVPITGELPSPINPPAGCAFHPRCPHAIPACREITPVLEPTDHPGHTAACIRLGEI